MKLSIKDFFSKCNQIYKKLRIGWFPLRIKQRLQWFRKSTITTTRKIFILYKNLLMFTQRNRCRCFPENILKIWIFLTLSWRRPISYRPQSIDLRSKSMDLFLYDIGLRHERVKKRCSQKWESGAATLLKSHFCMDVLQQICWIFSEKLFPENTSGRLLLTLTMW